MIASDFRGALELYRGLDAPSAADDRWAAVALYSTGQALEARALLQRARRRGDEGAIVELAAVARLLGDAREARHLLDDALARPLEPLDRVRALRESAELLIMESRLSDAANVLNEAWVDAQLMGEHHPYAGAIAQLLAYVEAERGLDGRARWYVDRALDTVTAKRRPSVLITRAVINVNLGQYDEAERDLAESLPFIGDARVREAVHPYASASLHLARGQLDRALTAFQVAARRAEQLERHELHCYARLCVAAVLSAMNEADLARAELQRARSLANSTAARAMLSLREGAYWTARGELDAGRAHLERALESFEVVGAGRECGWTHVWSAVNHLARGDERGAALALERAADVGHSVGNFAFFAPELRLIPDLDGLARAATPYGRATLRPVLDVLAPPDEPVRTTATRFRVATLGRPALLADGQQVHLSLSRSLELLAYLLMHPASTMETLLADVFPDQDPKAAKNYFHQIKHQIGRDALGLTIRYDRQTRTYTVDSGLCPLDWDYEDLQRALSAAGEDGLTRALDLYAGPFLQYSSAEWAERVRDDVEWLLVRSGLKTIQDLFDRGNYEACRRLTARLLEVAPLDETLHEILVRATTEIEGVLAARNTLDRTLERFATEVGEAPERLTGLRARLADHLN